MNEKQKSLFNNPDVVGNQILGNQMAGTRVANGRQQDAKEDYDWCTKEGRERDEDHRNDS